MTVHPGTGPRISDWPRDPYITCDQCGRRGRYSGYWTQEGIRPNGWEIVMLDEFQRRDYCPHCPRKSLADLEISNKNRIERK